MASKENKVEKNEESIFAFQKEESLWNVSSLLYKDRNVKKASLRRLGELFEMRG